MMNFDVNSHSIDHGIAEGLMHFQCKTSTEWACLSLPEAPTRFHLVIDMMFPDLRLRELCGMSLTDSVELPFLMKSGKLFSKGG